MPFCLQPSIQDIKDAYLRIESFITRTPLLEAPLLTKELGFRLLVKAESVQKTGSFKVRGAFNQLLQLTQEEKKRGVVAISSGNHAQAVAFAASILGVRATIVMPRDAPQLKLRNTALYGGEIVTFDRTTEDREEIGRRLSEERGLRMIHPYNDVRTIAGQATVGLEIFEQTKASQTSPSAIIVNCSGGGLAAGIALAGELYPSNRPEIFTAEPKGFDEMRASLDQGSIVANEKTSGSICDALLATSPGTITFPCLTAVGAQGFAATDAAVEAAMALAAEYFKLVLEPGGAVSIATSCLHRELFRGKTVVAIASGGNVDPSNYIDMITRGFSNRKLLSP